MVTALVIALLQSVPVSPPPSPAWPGPDYAQRYAAELKRTCMSDAGVALVVESWQRGLEESRARQARSHQIETELGEAAYTKPIDVARLERAARARDADQAEALALSLDRNLALLKRLSAADRILYAPRLSTYRPSNPAMAPQRRC